MRHWARNWFKRLQQSQAPVRKTRRPSTFRPMLECLEDRLAPAANFWTGASDNNWSNNNNWVDSGGTIHLAPISSSDVVFDNAHAGTHTTSVVDAAFTINSLSIASDWGTG